LRAFVDATAKTRKRLISIRVDEELLDLTKELARQHGMPYQAVIRVWIEEGLRRAIREGAQDAKSHST
jgi:predicted DNA binding CopG/RHH family protein